MQATTARKPMRRFGPEAGVLLTSSRMRDVDSAGVRLMFPPWNLRPGPGRRAQSRSGVCAVGMVASRRTRSTRDDVMSGRCHSGNIELFGLTVHDQLTERQASTRPLGREGALAPRSWAIARATSASPARKLSLQCLDLRSEEHTSELQ